MLNISNGRPCQRFEVFCEIPTAIVVRLKPGYRSKRISNCVPMATPGPMDRLRFDQNSQEVMGRLAADVIKFDSTPAFRRNDDTHVICPLPPMMVASAAWPCLHVQRSKLIAARDSTQRTIQSVTKSTSLSKNTPRAITAPPAMMPGAALLPTRSALSRGWPTVAIEDITVLLRAD